MYKLLLLCAACTLTLSACEQEKQSSAGMGKVPKQIIDKTINDIDKANAIAAEKLKDAENREDPAK